MKVSDTDRASALYRSASGTVCDLFAETVRARPNDPAIRSRDDAVVWSYADYHRRVGAVAGGLRHLGAVTGNTIAIWLRNRPEFHVIDMAAVHLGAVPFSVYNTFAVEQAAHVIGDAGSRILVTEAAFLESARAVRASGKTALASIVLVDGESTDTDDVVGLADLMRAGGDGFDLAAAAAEVEPDSLATLIYTSGTTGAPKGVQLTHNNIVSMLRAIQERLRFREGSRIISYLPMAHVAERLCTHYLPAALAFFVTTCDTPSEIFSVLDDVRPHFFFSPPRNWEKMRASVLSEQSTESETDLANLLERTRLRLADIPVPVELDEKCMRAETRTVTAIRRRLALDELDFAVVGSAPCPPDVIEFFLSLGIDLCQVYGLSEQTGMASANPRGATRLGTVGPPLPGVEIRVAEDGEILIRGEVVMAGYRNLPERTAEAIDVDGWLHTGDIGRFDEQGYLSVVDRKKDIIISSAGKNMSPTMIEATLKAESPLIAQACVVGDGRPYNVALLTLEPTTVLAFARRNGIDVLDEPATDPRVLAAVREGVLVAADRLARVEQIKRFVVLTDEWLPDSEELTPTMKLKRGPIAAKYADEIEALYEGTGATQCL